MAVHGPLTVAASPVEEHRLQMRRLSSRGSRAQLLRGMWDLPRPGLEPVSPALAGRFLTTAPPGKPEFCIINTLKSRRSALQGTINLHEGRYKQVQGEGFEVYGEVRELHQFFFFFKDFPLKCHI